MTARVKANSAKARASDVDGVIRILVARHFLGRGGQN